MRRIGSDDLRDLRAQGVRLIFILMQIEKASPTVFTPLDDGTGVLLNLNTLFYYSLNRTGAALWQQIEERRAVSLDDLLRKTRERFEVSEDAARPLVIQFIEQLENLKMVRVS